MSNYVIAGIPFTSKDSIVDRCKAVAGRWIGKGPIEGEDAAFVAALLALHPERDQKMGGSEVFHFLVQQHGVVGRPGWRTRCFFVVRSDGKLVAFSYMTIIGALPVDQKAA